MTSRMSTHPSSETPCALGSDPELSLAPAALSEDEMTTVLTHVRRKSDVFPLQIVDDAAPEAITDDEPTVPIVFRRTATLRGFQPRPVR
jgi:hypothetical protein